MKRKMTIGEKEYTFEITNRTVLKIDEVHGNAGTVFDGIVNANQYYTNAIKLISCACIDKEWHISDNEKYENLSPSEVAINQISDEITGEQLYYKLPGIAMNLILDYIGINKTDEKEKNLKTN